jgi:hypothetical protein
MEISIRIEKRADGQMLPRLACFVKRSHETKAKRFRKWHATQKSAEAQKREIQRVLKDKGMDGVADLLLGEAQKPTANRRMTDGAIQIFIDTKRAVEREERTVHDLESRLKPIKAKFGLCEVHLISATDLQQLLNDQAGNAQNKNNYARAWRVFFNWCAKTRIIRESPMDAIEVPNVKRGLPAIAKPWDIARLVIAALKDTSRNGGFRVSAPGVMLPYVLLTFFSGTRPEEAARLANEILSKDRDEIVLDEKITKISRVRPVRLMPELTQILRLLIARGFDIGHFSQRVLLRIRKRSAIKWSADIGRHSYASYSFALGVPEAELVADMGNSVPVLRKYYVNRLATRRDAARWRAILPSLLKRLKRDGG